MAKVFDTRNGKVKGFRTEKCKRCNNVIREEYNPIGKHKPCKVCNSSKWIEIKMNEVI